MPDITYSQKGNVPEIKAHISIEEIKEMLQSPIERIKELTKKNTKDKIGILVAIKTENNEERKRVENDIAHELNNFLNSKLTYIKSNIFPILGAV